MYLLANMFQTPHYQAINVVICMPEEFQVNELHLHRSHSDMKSNRVAVGSEVWGGGGEGPEEGGVARSMMEIKNRWREESGVDGMN